VVAAGLGEEVDARLVDHDRVARPEVGAGELEANLPNAEAERLYALAKRVASTGVAVIALGRP
jgi:hypothetical protein